MNNGPALAQPQAPRAPRAPRAAFGAIFRNEARLVWRQPAGAIARGLPPECIALATARMARINAAYDRLSGRGLHQPA